MLNKKKRKLPIDPAKAAIYNPKEFRCCRGGYGDDTQPRRSWLSLIAVAVIIGLFSYFWSRNVVSPQASVVPLPLSGAVERLRQESPNTAYAPLKLIGNRNGKHCMFRLEDWKTSAPVLVIFVRSGEAAETSVPLGQYRGKIACGATWYGAKLFGPGTVIDELAAPVLFVRNAAGTVTGSIIELT